MFKFLSYFWKSRRLDPKLKAFLEKRSPGLQDSDPIYLDEFEDSDLANYPAIEIPETNLSVEQCEKIVNILIGMMETCDEISILVAVRIISVLAYNTLMTPRANETPFFRKFTHREDWLRTNGVSTVDLIELCLSSQTNQPQDGSAGVKKFRLTNPEASDFERKCTIGYWAHSHLRALHTISGKRLRTLLGGTFEGKKFHKLYGFSPSYMFPLPSAQTCQQLLSLCGKNRIGEQMYLFYRSIIVSEQINGPRKSGRSSQAQNQLLNYMLVGPYGLGYAGLSLWNSCKSASSELGIPIEQLLVDLEWALQDSRWKKYSARSLETVDLLRQFYRTYEDNKSEARSATKSRYYMYAQIVDPRYFEKLHFKSSIELVTALNLVAGLVKSYQPDCYEAWGALIADKIQAKYGYRSRVLT